MSGKVYGEPFAVIPESVIYAEVGVTAKVLWGVLALHADSGGRCYPGRKRLAELMRVSEDTVKRAKKELADAGLIRCEERFGEDGRRTTDDLFLHPPRCTGAPGVGGTSAPTGSSTSNELEEIPTRPGGKSRPGAPQPQRTADETFSGFYVAGMNGSNKATDAERANGLARLRQFREDH